MSIITLTTDWNKEDFYIGSLKGHILNQCKDARIIDITHKTKSFNIPEAAFILRNTYPQFPAGTVHIIGVKSEASDKQEHVIVEKDGHYFIGADNGIFGLIFQEQPEKIIRISEKPGQPTFPALSLFSSIACKIIQGQSPDELGAKAQDVAKKIPIRPTIDDSVIIGKVVYIDSFSNAITNITKDLFYRVSDNRKFQIFVQSNANKISKISKTYNESPEGELLALFNSLNLLEIAMNGGNAAEILSLDTNSTIRIRFK
jgi:S-adenosylmethionine hydrolase